MVIFRFEDGTKKMVQVPIRSTQVPGDPDPDRYGAIISSTLSNSVSSVGTVISAHRAPGSNVGDRGDAETIAEDQIEDVFYQNDVAVFMKEDTVIKIVRSKLIVSAIRGPSDYSAYDEQQAQCGEGHVAPAEGSGVCSKSLWHPRVIGSGAEDDRRILAKPFRQAGAPVTSEMGSETSGSVTQERMPLEPAGEATLQARRATFKEERSSNKTTVAPTRDQDRPSPVRTFFDAAMGRFVKEKHTTETRSATTARKSPETQDVDVESVGSRHDPLDDFDPDDLSIDIPRRALKAFSGKDIDEDRARSWLGKVKSAFIHDRALDSEKCLVFGDLLTGPARNWHMQLSRPTRSNWKSLLEGFLIQYCGRDVSVARKYYHAMKRSDESPLEYLHRLNVAGMRAKLPIKDGSAAARREHVEPFIETLDDRELADQLALLRLFDADVLDESLRARQRAKSRQGRAAMGSTEDHVRQVYLAAANESKASSSAHQSRQDTERSADRQAPTGVTKRCSHCGATKHNDLGCWKRLTCQKCGRNGHPSDHCLFVCRACGELHGMGKCQMEEFYNMVRQLYNPTKHAGMLPDNAEKMLN
ncbi:unnamed protein product [Phytophthora fragariaefolia]|uniref:Unnamed protein product n=1 Tax=Phytophthora fragariaefolia TaxID=1490495 RepID=A0A9W6Y4Z1_9STRA|nr:unnamed protein product [Phytophthora fragariaefolia]